MHNNMIPESPEAVHTHTHTYILTKGLYQKKTL